MKQALRTNIRVNPAGRSDRRQGPEPSEIAASPSHHDLLVVTNEDSRYRLKYGGEFREMLDPRDQVMEHPFKFHVNLKDLEEGGGDFLSSKPFERLIDEANDFLA